jgi:hypothetical protein
LADELLLTISKDDIERAHYRSRRLFEMDRQSEIALATRVGEQRGMPRRSGTLSSEVKRKQRTSKSFHEHIHQCIFYYL